MGRRRQCDRVPGGMKSTTIDSDTTTRRRGSTRVRIRYDWLPMSLAFTRMSTTPTPGSIRMVSPSVLGCPLCQGKVSREPGASSPCSAG